MPENLNLVERFNHGPSTGHVYSGSIDVAERVETNVHKGYGADRDLVTEEQVERDVKNAMTDALTGYGELRLKGKQGDTKSRKPGFVAFVTEEGKKQAVTNFEFYDYPYDEQENIVPIGDGIWALNFPHGVYESSYGHLVQFYQIASEGFQLGNEGLQNPFIVSGREIIRIEGTGGGDELWQCHLYEVDGTLKQPPEQVA